MKSRFRPTKGAKVLLSILLIAVIVGCAVFGIKSGFIETKDKTDDLPKEITASQEKTDDADTPSTADSSVDEAGNVIGEGGDDVFNVSMDEWIGFKSIIDANGGYETAKGSIFDELGIKVNISVINDAAQSSNAFIRGDLDAAGYTINRLAFLSSKFKDAGKEVIMPYVTNYSNGGDGIISKDNIKSVEDLKGKKIGIPEFSEAETLIVWTLNQSDMSDKDKQEIIDNLITFETADDTAKAFFAGEIDVAATWEPYLTQAKNMSGARIFLSTADATNLILDGIVVDKKYAEEHPDVIQKFMQGTLMASEMYKTEFKYIKEVMPMFSTMSDEDIIGMADGANLTTWKDNDNLLKDVAPTVYLQMCDIWKSVGESADKDMVAGLFDSTYSKAIADNFSATEVSEKTAPKVTDDNVQKVIDTQALLGGKASVTFEKNTAVFTDSAAAAKELDKFIETAKVLDGAIIEIAGNTDPNPDTDPDDKYNKSLSYDRANAVANYFIMNGIKAERIHVIGNGSSNPVVDNDTDEHRAMNRRTDVSFKIIEK